MRGVMMEEQGVAPGPNRQALPAVVEEELRAACGGTLRKYDDDIVIEDDAEVA